MPEPLPRRTALSSTRSGASRRPAGGRSWPLRAAPRHAGAAPTAGQGEAAAAMIRGITDALPHLARYNRDLPPAEVEAIEDPVRQRLDG